VTNQRFMDIVRQYAKTAQQKHLSYAELVNHALRIRVQTINALDADPFVKDQQIATATDFVEREYGSIDDEWALPPTM